MSTFKAKADDIGQCLLMTQSGHERFDFAMMHKRSLAEQESGRTVPLMDVGAQSVKSRVRRPSSPIVAYSLEPAGRDQ